MSRVGRQPIIIPSEVTVKINNGVVSVAGPKGNLNFCPRKAVKVQLEDNQIKLSLTKENRLNRSLHGVSRTLIANMVKGVTEGYEKTLKIVGVGYRVKLEEENLILSLGFSHPVTIKPPPGIKFSLPDNETMKITGIDKAQVGLVTAKIRAIRPPEAYKGKGIRYLNEEVRKKAGKAGKTGAADLTGAK